MRKTEAQNKIQLASDITQKAQEKLKEKKELIIDDTNKHGFALLKH